MVPTKVPSMQDPLREPHIFALTIKLIQTQESRQFQNYFYFRKCIFARSCRSKQEMERGICLLGLTNIGDEQMVVAMATLYFNRFDVKLKLIVLILIGYKFEGVS